MIVALILLLVAVASVLFHIFSPWWWTPIASNWRYIDDTISLTFWITGFVFAAVRRLPVWRGISDAARQTEASSTIAPLTLGSTGTILLEYPMAD